MKKVKIEIFKSSNGTSVFISNDNGDGEYVAGAAPGFVSELVDSWETNVEELMKAVYEMTYE
ncbi:hypothetical protein ABE869_09930 [Enterococcus gilvus]|uniref:hypothetical protein n=1 Tax=Enterococcus gilvus TaxID=160453 RepID=UPI003D6C0B87